MQLTGAKATRLVPAPAFSMHVVHSGPTPTSAPTLAPVSSCTGGAGSEEPSGGGRRQAGAGAGAGARGQVTELHAACPGGLPPASAEHLMLHCGIQGRLGAVGRGTRPAAMATGTRCGATYQACAQRPLRCAPTGAVSTPGSSASASSASAVTWRRHVTLREADGGFPAMLAPCAAVIRSKSTLEGPTPSQLAKPNCLLFKKALSAPLPESIPHCILPGPLESAMQPIFTSTDPPGAKARLPPSFPSVAQAPATAWTAQWRAWTLSSPPTQPSSDCESYCCATCCPSSMEPPPGCRW